MGLAGRAVFSLMQADPVAIGIADKSEVAARSLLGLHENLYPFGFEFRDGCEDVVDGESDCRASGPLRIFPGFAESESHWDGIELGKRLMSFREAKIHAEGFPIKFYRAIHVADVHHHKINCPGLHAGHLIVYVLINVIRLD